MHQERWMLNILKRRREEGTLRELRTPEKDLCFVDFTSNDYLGLGRAAGLRQAAEAEARRAREVRAMSTTIACPLCLFFMAAQRFYTFARVCPLRVAPVARSFTGTARRASTSPACCFPGLSQMVVRWTYHTSWRIPDLHARFAAISLLKEYIV